MEKKPRLKLDMNKLTSGLSIQDTMKGIEDSAPQKTADDLRIFKKIHYKKLKSSPLNDYPMENLEEMEHLLLSYGLLEPLSVNYIEDEDMYEIESGDRRFHSLLHLFECYETENAADSRMKELYDKNVHTLYENGIYCIVENGPMDTDSKRSRIIIHNETSRPFDPIRTSSRLAELSEIYSRQNQELPASERVNVNQRISQELNGRYGIRQIIRYKNFDSLTDELKKAAVKYNMSISQISTYHNLTEEEQSVLAQYIEEYAPLGKLKELPAPEDIKSITAETHKEIESEMANKDISLPSDALAPIENCQPPCENTEACPDTCCPSSADNSDSLQDLKIRAAKKIIENKDKKETKIKNTINGLQKKSEQFEKAVLSYITDLPESEPDTSQLDKGQVIDSIELIVEKLNSIKETLSR